MFNVSSSKNRHKHEENTILHIFVKYRSYVRYIMIRYVNMPTYILTFSALFSMPIQHNICNLFNMSKGGVAV